MLYLGKLLKTPVPQVFFVLRPQQNSRNTCSLLLNNESFVNTLAEKTTNQ